MSPEEQNQPPTPEPSGASGERRRRPGRGPSRRHRSRRFGPRRRPAPSEPDVVPDQQEGSSQEAPQQAMPVQPADAQAPVEPVEASPSETAAVFEEISPAAAPAEQTAPQPPASEAPDVLRPQPVEQPAPPEARPPQFQPPHRHEPPSVTKAIEEVNQIIRTLTDTLDEMNEVLEVLEQAEREKIADEREIESLRRALRQLHRSRDEMRHHRPPQPRQQ